MMVKAKMIIPVRCFSCGKVIGDKWEPFVRRVAAGENLRDVLDDLGLDKYCCRRMIISHVEIIDKILKFYASKESLEMGYLKMSGQGKRDDKW